MLAVSATAWGDDYYLWYNNTSNDSGCENYNNEPPFKPSSAATASSSVCTWTGISLQTGNNFIYLSSTNNKDGLISLQSESTPSTSGSRISSADCSLDYGGYKYLRINTSGECTATIVINVSTKAVTVTQTSESVCKMHLQYPFDGSNWTWVEMVSVGDNIHFTYSATYQASRCGADISNTASDWHNNKQYYDLGVACAGMTSGVSNVLFTYTAPDANCTRTGGTLTMTSAAAPEVYIGEQPVQEGYALNGSVYLAQTGGMAVTDIKVYYANGAEPTEESPYVTLTGPFSCGNLYPFTIDGLCEYGEGTGLSYQIKAVATNAVGSGESDVVTTGFDCCYGAITSMTLSAESDYVVAGQSYGFHTSIRGGGANPTYDWYVSTDGETWEAQTVHTEPSSLYYIIPRETPGGTTIYVKCTVTGSNCDGDTRTKIVGVSTCYTPTVTLPANLSTRAWVDLAINATVANVNKFKWNVTPDGPSLLNPTASSVTFRGGSSKGSSTDYSVTLTVSENSCGTEVTSNKLTVTVSPDADECGE